MQASSCIKVLPLGSLIVCATYFAFISTLVFINNDVLGAQHYQALGIRAGWLAVAQLPLLVLLSSKTNLIGLLCSLSYERLNIYHRWVARGLLLLATFHFAFQSHGWNVYGLMQLEWDTDLCPPTGMAAYAILLWMNIMNSAPLRHWSYKFFVVQHLLTYFGLTIAIAYHVSGTTSPHAANYVYISAALYIACQLVRFVWIAIKNFPASKSSTSTCILTAVDDGVTRIRISTKNIKRWSPGSHVRIYMPRFDLVHAHPATILSTPTSHGGELVFLLRSHRGFTRKIHQAASNTSEVADVQAQSSSSSSSSSYRILIDGPYCSSHADFGCFDTLVLIAGSTGVTFTVSNLLDLADRVKSRKSLLPLRVIYFIWVVKKKSWISWVNQELQSAFKMLEDAGIEIHFIIHITCADNIAGHSDFSGSNSIEGEKGQCKCPRHRVDDDGNKKDDKEKEKSALSALASQTTSKNSLLLPFAPYAAVHFGRPTFRRFLARVICEARGETAVAVCGPLGLSVSVRSAVVWASDELAVNKGSGLQGVYLHVENFA